MNSHVKVTQDVKPADLSRRSNRIANHACAAWRSSLLLRRFSVGKALIDLPALCSARRNS